MNSYLRSAFVCLLSIMLLSITSCGKKAPEVQPAQDIGGVKVDLPKLQTEFANAPQPVLDELHQTTSSLRYGQYEKALQSLDKMVNDPAVTDAQKKVVAEVIEQMKQVIAKVGPNRQ